MPEILTESFCERCGTRYTFEAAAPSRRRLGRLRVVSRGLKNYVLSDESSLEEAFAEARSDDERAVTSQQLDAFHQTFNFCMSCRQYTCANCWNAADGRCLTCAPHLGREVLQAPFPTLDPQAGIAVVAAAEGNGHAPDEAAWPAADLGIAPAAEPGIAPAADLGIAPAADLGIAPAADLGIAPTADLDIPPTADAVTVAPEAARVEDVATQDRAALAAAETTAFLARFRPGESIDSALEAYEEESAPGPAMPVASEPEAAAAVAESEAVETVAESEAVAAIEEPEAVSADVEPPGAEETEAADAATVPAQVEATPAGGPPSPLPAVAAAAAPPAETAPEPEKPARLAAAAAAWQVVAPDNDDQAGVSQPSPTPAWPPLPPGTEAPQWPATPAWPAARAGGPTRGDDLLWAESSRDVLSPPAAGQRTAAAVQPCVSCGLALSSTARFCRRCGSQQG